MSIESSVVQSADMAGRPLCTTYDVVRLSLLAVRVERSDAAIARTICWGLGTHRTGDTEVIGTWFAGGDADFGFDRAATALAQRGLIRVTCLVMSGAEDADAASGRSASVHVGSSEQPEMVSVGDAGLRLHGQRLRCAEAARRFDLALRRSLHKRFFQSDQQALDCVGEELDRLERRICWTTHTHSSLVKTRARPRPLAPASA